MSLSRPAGRTGPGQPPRPTSTFPLGPKLVRRSGYGAMHAADATEIACVQNLFHLADRGSAPLLQECLRRGIAFVPFCPLGIPRGAANPVLNNPVVIQTAARLGVTSSQVALQWLLQLAPNVLLIPGTGSAAHLQQNLAAEYVALDDQALRELAAVGG